MKKFVLITIIILILIFCAACAGPAKLAVNPIQIAVPGKTNTPIIIGTRGAAPTKTADDGAAIWVANPADRVIVRIDPVGNKAAALIPVEGSPEIVAPGENAVWALDRQHNLVFRIDPQTNQVKAAIHLPAGNAADLVSGDGAVWVGMTGKIDLTNQAPGPVTEISPPGIVVQIDPNTNTIVQQYPIQPVSRIALAGESLWILSRTLIDTPVQVIDLNSKQGMAMPFHNAPEWLPADALAVDSGNLWLFSSAYGKIFRATLDGHINSVINLEEHQPTGYADLLLYGSSLWAATPWGTLLRIDPQSNHIQAAIDLGAPLTTLIGRDNAVWVHSQQTATLFRINLSTNAVTAQIKTGSLLEPTIVPSPTPRIVLWKPCPDAATSRLKIGDLAYVTKDPPLPNRIRKDPNTDAEILGYITPGGSMEIIGGPSCSNGWVWWQVKNADLTGWTPEGDKETYWLIPLYK